MMPSGKTDEPAAGFAEIIFNPVLWPDYTREEYRRDLACYAARDRRFGKV